MINIDRRNHINNVIDSFTATEVYKIAYRYLQDKGQFWAFFDRSCFDVIILFLVI